MAARGTNLKAGQADGDAGRRAGGRASRRRQNAAPRDWPCQDCEIMGYTTKAQCWGHRGFAKVMLDRPEALHSLIEKIAKTGRADSKARWVKVSSNGS